MQKSEFTQAEEQMIQREFEALLEDYAHTPHRQKVELITHAFNFANQAHYGVRRLSGEPYILHPIAVARICVREIGLGSTSICSALLHDVVEDTDYSVEDIRGLFGDKIAQIVDGLTKISGGVFGDHASEQAENFRKLLLTISDDIRVVLIKIADRLHNMRTLGAQPKDKQYKIAGETQYIYAPLAHRLGLFPIKTELEDLSFKYEHPETWQEINDKLANVKEHQLASFEHFAEPIRERLTSMGYRYTLKARIKSVYSIWKKMMKQQCAFEDVYDLLAVRIIFTPNESMSEKDQCWMIYSAITEIYRPHPERIRDWISTPKANGYEALHVTVMGKDGQWIEVQIRTDRMNEIAERGYAAHWKYKTGESDDSELDKWLREIKEILAHPDKDAMEFLGTFKLNLFAQEVFVFTPKGEIKTMPLGSTALDFAFMLHSELGEHCIGAKVNHALVPLSYRLKGGDQIEILTSNSQHPQKEWMDMVTTAKAKNSLQQYFRREERRYMKHGERLVEDAIKIDPELSANHDTVLARLLNYYQMTQPSELYAEVGQGAIRLDNIREIVFPRRGWKSYIPFLRSKEETAPTLPEEKENKPTPPLPEGKEIIAEKPKKKVPHAVVLTDDELNKKFVLSQCCHPIPGDEVLGYMDEEGLMHIHKIDCPEANLLKTSYGKRIYSATWNTHRVQSFVETIELKGIDKFGVFIHVLQTITTDFHINMRAINISSEDGIFKGTMEVYVYDRKELDDLLKAIRKIDDIKEVKRVTGES
ncbi:MAG: bifunctional (p)ppGpp synthetase/guanosine-3',5'-bis(diphosphate) 3'-pyrophosphohydrolase [Paludibacteraceae bacterium]|nr:bifunctional (p)ppGpp synthetase/guanosine-3',5'-bis(diphosphate) 3'-pyrophosphohydrolase [Paludibacteraceae bacterium]